MDYDTNDTMLHLYFSLKATYRRVKIENKLQWLDDEIGTHDFQLVLSKNLTALQTSEKEIAFSYECPSCGAPYDDTTNSDCNYCGAPIIDTAKNWVLTDFNF